MIIRTEDLDTIDYVLKHPKIRGSIGDDVTSKMDIDYPISENVYYLAEVSSEVLGMFVFYPQNSVTFEGHFAVLPGLYGKNAIRAGLEAIDWIFGNTECLKINGVTPHYNPLALRYAQKLGFKKEGVNCKSILKDGKLHDQTFFGLEREEWVLKQQ